LVEEDRVITYDPLTTVAQAECKAQPSTRVVSCPGCGKRFAAIVTFDIYDSDFWMGRSVMYGHMITRTLQRLGLHVPYAPMTTLKNSPLVQYDVRAIFCDHCDRVILWTEHHGVEITKPLIIADRRLVNAFLLRHPEAAGVEQA
jgi:hypothetical protein